MFSGSSVSARSKKALARDRFSGLGPLNAHAKPWKTRSSVSGLGACSERRASVRTSSTLSWLASRAKLSKSTPVFTISNQTITLQGTGATSPDSIALEDAQAFAALVAVFGAGEQKDSIDAMNFAPPPATTWSFSENAARTLATLTLTDSADVAHLHLSGDYVKSDFSVGPDAGGTGTLINFV
jgi:hypothetical protein